MKVSLIVAAAENNAIGKGNQLLWRLPNDLKYFKNVTWALPVAMGRKTYESLSGEPLPGRLNIVITRQADWSVPNVVVVNNLKDAIFVAQQHDYKEIMIAGGGEIYKEALPHADRIYLTRVHAELPADTFFPAISSKEWELVSNQDYKADEKHAYDYSFQVWERK